MENINKTQVETKLTINCNDWNYGRILKNYSNWMKYIQYKIMSIYWIVFYLLYHFKLNKNEK